VSPRAALFGIVKQWEVLASNGQLWEAMGSFRNYLEVLGSNGKFWEVFSCDVWKKYETKKTSQIIDKFDYFFCDFLKVFEVL
jgi:hypothetical protein